MGVEPRILFVDDDALARSALRRALVRYGFEVDLADGHAQATELARRRSYAIIAVDYLMPQVNGLDLIPRLRLLQPQAAFLVITGQPDLDVALRAVNELGVQAVIPKPWDNEALARRLHALLDTQLQSSERQEVDALVIAVRQAADAQRALLDTALHAALVAESAGGAVESGERLRQLELDWNAASRELFTRLGAAVNERQAHADSRARFAEIGQQLQPRPAVAPALTVALDDRRGHPRVPFVVAVRLLGSGKTALGQSEDLSLGGMFVATEASFPIDTRLTVEFSPPGGELLSCACRVAWLRPDNGARDRHRRGPGIGVQFSALTEPVRAAIAAFTERWEQEGSRQLDRLLG